MGQVQEIMIGMNISKKIIFFLLIPIVLLPLGIAFLLIFGRVFAMLEDQISGNVLDWVAFFLAFLWVIDLTALVVALGLRSLKDEQK